MLINSNKDSNSRIPENKFPSKLKTYGFAITLILGLGFLGFSLGGLGHFYLGGINSISYIPAVLILIAAGGVGLVLTITGLIGSLKQSTKPKP